ncbi:hypothetical protein CPG37_01235 [Malaciobacter canalis]|uniref:Uncharacterized protein n=1 Tax=Malaciobacter canalis TaxID=1912871 RepID=A0ABX4LT81_9BACT|nr:MULTISPECIES: hypothetical protein [Malaciobacter]PHO11097.1 hypothetical protein CPG37_01235 [Malaciobacter canalis]QEE33182.1 hypothetical protein ACAN_1710 [Malaciobacter canalis]SKB67435.1 hypothetical protein SAMN06295997_12941 [Malaciobacter marinus]
MQEFKITDEIKNLDLTNIRSNLFHYKYDNKYLKNLYTKDGTLKEESKESPTYHSFKGEVFENIIYEHLLRFAQNNDEIKRFVLKGPHQNKNNIFKKNGLLIDKGAQIVYKSVYKDISEFDALFFTKDSIYFVEMSKSKKTSGLNKRLFKKFALLKLLFPSFEIKALIVLTQGSIGLSRFPDYCTIWITKEFDDEQILKELILNKVKKESLIEYKDKKFIEALNVRYKKFSYFETLEWILHKSRAHQTHAVDLSFFKCKKLSLYFDIFTKLYIGFITIKDFKQLVPYEGDVKDNKVIVTIEKINQKKFEIVYYLRQTNHKLKRVSYSKEKLSIEDKDPEGFTNKETRFISKILLPEHRLLIKNINNLSKKLEEKYLVSL